MKQQTKILKIKTYFIVILVVVALYLLISVLSLSFLQVKINPSNAVILIDNAPVKLNRQGVTKKIITVGKHKLEVQADGYIGISETINIKRLLPSKFEVKLAKINDANKIAKGNLISKGKSNSEFFYLGNQGKTLFKTTFINNNGKIEPVDQAITGAVLSNVEEITWSPDKELALLRKSSGDITLFDFKKYDFVSQTETNWGKDIGSIAWTEDNQKIAYYYRPENTLIFSDIANKEPRRVLNFSEYNITDPILRWSPDSETLLIIPQDKKYENNKIYALNRYTLEMTTLTESGSQLDAVFSPDSQKILFFSYSEDPQKKINSIVSIMDKNGSNKKSFDIRANISKIAWAGPNTLIICSPDKEGREKLYYYDINTSSQIGGALTGISNAPIQLLTEVNNGKIIIYQSGGEIFYLEIDS